MSNINFATLPGAVKVSPELAKKFQENATKRSDAMQSVNEAMQALIEAQFNLNSKINEECLALWTQLETETGISTTGDYCLDSEDAENCWAAPRAEFNKVAHTLTETRGEVNGDQPAN